MAPSPSLPHPKTLPEPPPWPGYLGPVSRVLSPPPTPRGEERGHVPWPHSSLPLGLPGGLQLTHRKHLLLNNQVGKLRHKVARAVPSFWGADPVRCHLSPCLIPPGWGLSPSPGHHPLPHWDPAPLAPSTVLHPSCRETAAVMPGGPRTPGSWGPGAGGKTVMLAAATPGVPAPPRGWEAGVTSPQ